MVAFLVCLFECESVSLFLFLFLNPTRENPHAFLFPIPSLCAPPPPSTFSWFLPPPGLSCPSSLPLALALALCAPSFQCALPSNRAFLGPSPIRSPYRSTDHTSFPPPPNLDFGIYCSTSPTNSNLFLPTSILPATLSSWWCLPPSFFQKTLSTSMKPLSASRSSPRLQCDSA